MATVTAGNVGADTMAMSEKQMHDHVLPIDHGKISLQEYMYWAELKRAEEDADTAVIHSKGFGQLFAMAHKDKTEEKAMVNEAGSVSSQDDLAGLSEREIELVNARRMLRQAGWATVFFLITCDILGPFNAPYSIGAIGYVPGTLLYVLFGAAAAAGGAMLCKIYCRVDSARYPIVMYGDLAERIFGRWARHVCSFLQTIQLIINVGLICLTNGQSLSQVTKGHLCFSVCVVIWAIVGMIFGNIRGLQNFSILANGSVWLNLLLIFLSMGFIANSPPNYAAAFASYGISEGPVVTANVVGGPLFVQVNGVFNMVFAYGGAMIFPEIMAEMRRPKRDFIKGMAMAQALIFSVYLTYGCVIYHFQGQFVLAQAYTGVSKYGWQTIGNVIAMVTGIIAAGLYGNIGLKVLYINVVEDICKGPPIMSPKGRVIWSIGVVVYWALAFIVGSAIPEVGALSGLIAAAAIFHFTYTFPPLLMLGLDVSRSSAADEESKTDPSKSLKMQIDAAHADEKFHTPGVIPKQIDTWKSASRWKRAIFAGGSRRLLWKVVNLLFFIAALATAGLGLWATGTDVKESYGAGAATSFGCTANV